MMGMPFSGLTETLLYFSLGIGYIVLYLAKREEKALQLIGYVIGTGIIVLALISIIGNLFLGFEYNRAAFRHKAMMKEPMMQRHMMQPRPLQPSIPKTPERKP